MRRARTLLRRRRPVVLKLTAAVPRDRVDDAAGRAPAAAAGPRRGDEVWVNSRYVTDVMAGWGREMHVVPAGVDVETFRPCAPRAPEPLVVCTAATGEPRKRLVDLVDAWPAVVDAVPAARLMLVQRHDAQARAALLDRLPGSLHRTVSFDGPYDDAAPRAPLQPGMGHRRAGRARGARAGHPGVAGLRYAGGGGGLRRDA